MIIIELPRNEKSAQGFAAFYAHQERARRIRIRRQIHWCVRKSAMAELIVNRVLEAGRKLARDYMRIP
jgi:hypothetical protein